MRVANLITFTQSALARPLLCPHRRLFHLLRLHLLLLRIRLLILRVRRRLLRRRHSLRLALALDRSVGLGRAALGAGPLQLLVATVHRPRDEGHRQARRHLPHKVAPPHLAQVLALDGVPVLVVLREDVRRLLLVELPLLLRQRLVLRNVLRLRRRRPRSSSCRRRLHRRRALARLRRLKIVGRCLAAAGRLVVGAGGDRGHKREDAGEAHA